MQVINYFKNHPKIKYIILGVVVLTTVILSGFLYGEDNYFLNPTFGSITFLNNNAVAKYVVGCVPKLLTSYFVISGAEITYTLVHYLLHKALNKNQRSETILKMLYSFSKYGIAIFVILVILTIWGVDSGALLASAGGLALVVGLGAQSLIADVLAGIFIVFEGEFNVGDIVIIDGYRGKVLSIGIRSTKIRDIYGDIKTINNAQITTVVNKTKELSMADVTIGINYGESIEKVEAIFKKEVKKIKAKIPEAEEEVVYLGVQDLSASSVDLLFITYCKEESVMAVRRKMRRELKLIFDNYNIEIPYQHVTLENKENGFVSAVKFDESLEDNEEETLDFENLLFNKAIPTQTEVVEEPVQYQQPVAQPTNQQNVNMTSFQLDEDLFPSKPKLTTFIDNDEDEFIVDSSIQVLTIGAPIQNNSAPIKPKPVQVQEEKITQPVVQQQEEIEYDDIDFGDVFITDEILPSIVLPDEDPLDDIIGGLVSDNEIKVRNNEDFDPFDELTTADEIVIQKPKKKKKVVKVEDGVTQTSNSNKNLDSLIEK